MLQMVEGLLIVELSEIEADPPALTFTCRHNQKPNTWSIVFSHRCRARLKFALEQCGGVCTGLHQRARERATVSRRPQIS